MTDLDIAGARLPVTIDLIHSYGDARFAQATCRCGETKASLALLADRLLEAIERAGGSRGQGAQAA